MPRFVNNASWSHHFNADLIESISKGRKRESGFGYVHTAKLKDGGEIVIDSNDASDLTDPVVAVIAAAPGYSVIWTGIDGEEGPWVHRQPILAWQVMQSGEMRPVTIRGPNDGDHDSSDIEQPTGEIWCPQEDTIHPTIDVYQQVFATRASERLAEIAATAPEEKA